MGDATARYRRRGRDGDVTSSVLRRLESTAPPRGWVPPRPGEPDVSGRPDGSDRDGAAAAPDATPPDGASNLASPPDLAKASLEPFSAFATGAEPASLRLRVARFAPAGRAIGGLALLIVLAVVTALVTLWLARPREQPVPARAQTVGARLEVGSASPAGSAGPASTVGPAAAGPAATVLVHVVGAVRHPGVVELPPGSRVTDAVEAAGGVTRRAATASVNLARPVVDGEQVVVLRRGDRSAPAAPGVVGPSGSSSAGASAPGPVDLNTASLDQLDGLPGIGPVLAQRILDWRTAHGRFSTVEELGEVSGIGEATLADLRPVVRV